MISKIIKTREFILLVFVIVMVIGISIVNPSFGTASNLIQLLSNVTYTTIAAIGMSMVIITGGIDVSMGAVLSALAICCGNMALADVPVPIWILLTIILGSITGLLNGFFVAKMKVPSIVCTLAVSSIVSGLLIVITEGKWVYGTPESFNIIGKGSIAGIPISIIIMVVILVWATWFMSRSQLGRNIYAVGGNLEAAKLTSINTDRVIILTYVIASTLLGIATIVYSTRLTSITSDSGTNFHMPLIAAAVIGGTDILGGSGRPIGAFLGALVLEVFRSSLVYLNISTYWESAFQGILILVAVLLGAMSFKSRKKVAE